jgi:L-alanine-DL-glutamate epimerase-like enolase superfamily enzyme
MPRPVSIGSILIPAAANMVKVALYRAISQRPAEEMAENVAAHRADGRMVASDRPGLGVELNMDALGDAVAEYTV